MKKKGLIIATIVMVLVLAVSLTTATYAWFAATASTKVDTIQLSVTAANVVSIGAHTGAGNTQDDYMYETVTLGHGEVNAATANVPSYTGGTTGLGNILAFTGEGTTTLSLSTAVSSATSVTKASAPTGPSANMAFDPAKVIYKANSSQASDSAIDPASVNFANANEDYVVLKMGAQASKAGVKGIYAEIKVTTTDSATTLKMMAAMHFYIKVGNSAFDEIDLFGSNTYKTSKGSLTTSTKAGVVYSKEGTAPAEQAIATIRFLIAGDVTSIAGTDLAYDGSAIVPFEIYAFVDGTDPDCISTQTGCAAKFDIEFFGVTKAADIIEASTLLGYVPEEP